MEKAFKVFKIQTIESSSSSESSSKSVYFSRDSLCFIYFDVIICQRLKKKFKIVEPFFSFARTT